MSESVTASLVELLKPKFEWKVLGLPVSRSMIARRRVGFERNGRIRGLSIVGDFRNGQDPFRVRQGGKPSSEDERQVF